MKYTASSKVDLRLILKADCSNQFYDDDDDGKVFDGIYYPFYRAVIAFMVMVMMMMMSLEI